MLLLRLVTLTIVALAASAPRSVAHAQESSNDNPAIIALRCNRKLRTQYQQLRLTKLSESGASLRVQLEAIEGVETLLKKWTGSEPSDVQPRYMAERARAVAWLHGWSIFSRLVVTVSSPKSGLTPDERARLQQQLLSLEEQDGKPTSVFGYLLRVYQQMSGANGTFKKDVQSTFAEEVQALHKRLANLRDNPRANAAEVQAANARLKLLMELQHEDDPLRLRLRAPDGLLLLFSEKWPKNDGRYYVPAAEALLGKPSDLPSLDNHGLLSVWSLVNLQLDTWHNWASPGLWFPPETPGLGPLAEWLLSFSKGSVPNAVATLGSDRNVDVQRLSRLGNFLKFRDQAANEKWLQQRLKQLSKDRQNENPAGPIVVEQLYRAAQPLENGEYLPDAAIWLRYVVLLSYQREGSLGVVGTGDKSLSQYWKKCDGTGFKFAAKGTKRRTSRFLRWNQLPPKGHCADVLADLTNTAYDLLVFQKQLIELEKARYGKDNKKDTPPQSQNYFGQLGCQADFFLGHIRGRITQPCKWRDDLWSKPADNQLQTVKHKLAQSESWAASVTRSECKRLAGDLSVLAARANSVRQTRNILGAEKSQIQRFGGIALFGGIPELGDVDLNRAPGRTLNDYAKEVEDLAQEISQQISEAQLKDHLLREYAVQQEELAIAQYEASAARFALHAAKYGLEMARIYRRVAELDRQIAGLKKQIAQFENQAADNLQKAKGIRLTLAMRARDLAAAQLAGLEAALRTAEEKLIPQATKDLNELRRQAQAAAKHIRAAKRKRGLFGLIRAAIRIIGAALAPFTGGTSLQIAQVATQAVSVIEKAEGMNWGSLGEIVSNVAVLAPETEMIGTNLAKVSGVKLDQLKEHFAGIQKFIKGVESNVNEARTFFEENLEQLQPLVNSLQSAANGLPITLDNAGNVKLSFSLRQLAINDDALKDLFTDVLKSGRVLSTDLQARVASLSQLPLLKNEDLEKALKEAAPLIIKELPPDLRTKIQDMTKARKTKKELEERFKKWLARRENEAKNEWQERLAGLANILGGGAAVMLDEQNNAIIIERPVKKELEAIKKRLNNAAQGAAKEAIDGVVQKINKERERLANLIKQAQDAKDEHALQRIANEIPRVVQDLVGGSASGDRSSEPQPGSLLAELKAKVEEARAKLEDKQMLADVARFEQAAAEFRSRAAELSVESALKEVQKALLMEEYSEANEDAAQEELASKEAAVAASARRVELARRRLSWAREDCLAYGINPDAVANRKDIEIPSAVTLAGVLTLRRADHDTFRKWLIVRRMVHNYVGMLQWLHLLNTVAMDTQSETGTTVAILDAEEEYRELLVESLKSGNTPDQLVAYLEKKAKNLKQSIQESKTAGADITLMRVTSQMLPPPEYLSEMSVKMDPWLSRMPDNLRKQACARIMFRVVPYVTADLPFSSNVKPKPENVHLLTVASLASVVSRPLADKGTYHYIIVPPLDGRVAPEGGASPLLAPNLDLILGGTAPIVADVAEQLLKLNVKDTIQPWATNYVFSGAYGVWTVYLFDTRGRNEERNKQELGIDGRTNHNGALFTILIPALKWQPSEKETGVTKGLEVGQSLPAQAVALFRVKMGKELGVIEGKAATVVARVREGLSSERIALEIEIPPKVISEESQVILTAAQLPAGYDASGDRGHEKLAEQVRAILESRITGTVSWTDYKRGKTEVQELVNAIRGIRVEFRKPESPRSQ